MANPISKIEKITAHLKRDGLTISVPILDSDIAYLLEKEIIKAFNAGYNLGEYEASMCDWERYKGERPKDPGFKNVKEYFKKKLKC